MMLLLLYNPVRVDSVCQCWFQNSGRATTGILVVILSVACSELTGDIAYAAAELSGDKFH